MTKVYLLIDTDRGRTLSIAELVRNMPGITVVDVTTGPHDVIAVLEGTDPSTIASGPIRKIRSTHGVKYVTTCFAVRPSTKNAEVLSIKKVNKTGPAKQDELGEEAHRGYVSLD